MSHLMVYLMEFDRVWKTKNAKGKLNKREILTEDQLYSADDRMPSKTSQLNRICWLHVCWVEPFDEWLNFLEMKRVHRRGLRFLTVKYCNVERFDEKNSASSERIPSANGRFGKRINYLCDCALTLIEYWANHLWILTNIRGKCTKTRTGMHSEKYINKRGIKCQWCWTK